jgi:hypothetical protein
MCNSKVAPSTIWLNMNSMRKTKICLAALNAVLVLDGSQRKRLVSEDELEAVLTYFEFESFFQRDNTGVLARYAPYRDLYTEAEDEQETPCQVCNDPDYTDVNQIVFCDGCNLCVHQLCYGVAEIPAGSWLCRRCALRDSSRHNPPCRLCPLRGGAMWPCAGGVGWAHVLCALFMPGATFAPDSGQAREAAVAATRATRRPPTRGSGLAAPRCRRARST